MRPPAAWVASEPAPLLSGLRTGFANVRCYAASSSDCDSKISGEHWLSAGVLRALSPMTLEGVHWLDGAVREMSVKSLQSNILCRRHNNALSPLDAAAEKVVRFVREDEKALERIGEGPERPGDRDDAFTLISGPTWERWLLKLLMGAMASGSLGDEGERIGHWTADADVPALVETLFYGAAFSAGTGIAVRRYEPDPKGSPDSVGVVPLTSLEGPGLVGVALDLGVIEMIINVVPVRDIRHRRIGSFRLTREEPAVVKALAFAWPDAQSENITMRKAQPGSGL